MLEYQAIINGITYSADALGSIQRKAQLFDRPGVGNVCMATATIRVRPGTEEFPPFASARLQYREEGAQAWEPYGSYNINQRRKAGSFLQLRLCDAIVKTEPAYKDVTAFTTWPQADTAVVQEIASEIGVGIEAATLAMLGSYSVPMPQDWTIREVLGYIAGSYAANWIVTKANELRLVPLALDLQLLSTGSHKALAFNSLAVWLPDAGSAGGPSNATNLRRSVDRFEDLGRQEAYTGIELWTDEETLYSAGDDSGAVMQVDCPWGNQSMADALLPLVAGYHYRAFEAQRALLPPETEPGTAAVIDGVAVVLSSISASCGGILRADLASPAAEEAEDEFETTTEREIHRRVKLGQAYQGVRTSREFGLQVLAYDVSGNETGDCVTLNTARFLVRNASGAAILDIDFVNQTFAWNGDIIIQDGSISWGKLDGTVSGPINGNSTNIFHLVNGIYQGGTYIDGRQIYVPELVSPVIRGSEIYAYGYFGVYDATGEDLAGYIGRGYGSDGVSVTKGVVLCTDHPDNLTAADNYVIVTNAGVRLQAGGHQLYLIGRGAFLDGLRIATEDDLDNLRTELQGYTDNAISSAIDDLRTELQQYVDNAISGLSGS